jgi:hypothetical protein
MASVPAICIQPSRMYVNDSTTAKSGSAERILGAFLPAHWRSTAKHNAKKGFTKQI